MSVNKHLQRKEVIVEYDKKVVKGRIVACSAAKPGGELVEKKDVPNRGFAFFSFGAHFTGDVDVSFTGSAGGTDAGTIHVD